MQLEQLINQLKEEIFYLQFDVEYLTTEEGRTQAREKLSFKKIHLDQLIQAQQDEWEN